MGNSQLNRSHPPIYITTWWNNREWRRCWQKATICYNEFPSSPLGGFNPTTYHHRLKSLEISATLFVNHPKKLGTGGWFNLNHSRKAMGAPGFNAESVKMRVEILYGCFGDFLCCPQNSRCGWICGDLLCRDAYTAQCKPECKNQCRWKNWSLNSLPPKKLRCPLKINGWKMYFAYRIVPF